MPQRLPYKMILLNNLSSQAEFSHMKRGVERSKAHFLAESWGDWITVLLNMDGRWGKSRGLQGKIFGKRKKLENPGKHSVCITGWERNNTWNSIHKYPCTYTHRATHPQAPLFWCLHKHLWSNCALCWQNEYHSIDFHLSWTSDSMIQGKDLDLM